MSKFEINTFFSIFLPKLDGFPVLRVEKSNKEQKNPSWICFKIWKIHSAGMLAYKKDWKIIDDSNAIRFIVFFITGKWVNVYLIVFRFFRKWLWIRQHDPFGTKIGKFNFVFKEYCCLLVFSLRIWNVLWMRFWLKNLLHQLKK